MQNLHRTQVRSLSTLVTHWLTDNCLVDLIDVYDTNCFMMLQKLLKAVKSFSRLEKKLCKLSPADKGWQRCYLKMTNWLTHSCWEDLIDVTLAFEDANSNMLMLLVMLMLIINDEECADDSLVNILKLRFGWDMKVQFWLRFWSLILNFWYDLKEVSFVRGALNLWVRCAFDNVY